MITILPGPEGWPPTITDEQLRFRCPHCGKPYVMTGAYHRHLIARHGWSRRPDGELLPPRFGNDGRERRAA